MIALAQAGFLLKEPRYMDAAVQTQRFIEENMTDQNNRLFLRYRDGEAAHTGQLEDYAVYALSLLELYRLTLRRLLSEAGHTPCKTDDRLL